MEDRANVLLVDDKAENLLAMESVLAELGAESGSRLLRAKLSAFC